MGRSALEYGYNSEQASNMIPLAGLAVAIERTGFPKFLV